METSKQRSGHIFQTADRASSFLATMGLGRLVFGDHGGTARVFFVVELIFMKLLRDIVQFLLLLAILAVVICFSWPRVKEGSSVAVRTVVEYPPCRNASAAISVATTVLNAFAQVVVVPALTSESNTAIIPAQEEDHVWVDEKVLQHFQLDTFAIKTAVPDAQSITTSAQGFGLEVRETRFRFTYLGVRCYGHFTATLNNTDIDAEVGFTLLPERRWNATFTQLKFTWGTLAIQHELDSKACGIAQSVIELFTGQMDKYIAEKVRKKLDEDGKQKATETLNTLFENSNILALSPPIMTPMQLSVVLDLTPGPLECEPQQAITTLPPLLPRDIAAHVTVHDINNVLYNAATRDRLQYLWDLPTSMNTSLFADVLPELYEMCPECPLAAIVGTKTQPKVIFLPANTVTMTLQDFVVGLYVQPRNTKERSSMRILRESRGSKMQPMTEAIYRSLGFIDSKDYRHMRDDIPVLVLSFMATFGVQNVTYENDRAIRFNVLPVHDFDVQMVASNIGDVNLEEIQEKGEKVWNDVVVPMLNARSPLKVPFFVREPLLQMTLETADGGINIGFMKEFVAALNSL